jgi:hypothetical protein
MPKRAEVEEFRLTPQQVGFNKRFRILKQKQQLLEGATLQTQERVKTLKGLWGELNGEFDKLQMPAEALQEFEGMEDEVEPSADSRWNIEY